MHLSFAGLSGPFIPAKNPIAHACVVFLHGYGASGSSLEPLAKAMNLPDVSFWFPNAPKLCKDNPLGYEWFDLQGICLQSLDLWPPALVTDLEEATKILSKSLACLADHFPKTKIFLAGFSQGAALAYACGLMGYPVEGVLGFSGFYTLNQAPTYCPPLFWAHGQEDSVVPFEWMKQGVRNLQEKGLKVLCHEAKGQGHVIDKETLLEGRSFIEKILNKI